MKWKIFAMSTLACIIGALLVFTEGKIAEGIGMSIIAAYIFYIPIDFVPSLVKDWEKKPAKAISYRKLQLLLQRLDEIFISVYKAASKDATENPTSELRLEDFYNPDAMQTYMTNFDMQQKSHVHSAVSVLSFYDYARSNWSQINELAHDIIQSNSMDDVDLLFELNYLTSESTISHVFYADKIISMASIDCASYLGLNQRGSDSQKRTFENIIKLHQAANKYYNKLRRDKRCKAVLHPPIFYSDK